MPLALQMTLILSAQIPDGHHGQGPFAVPASRLACPAGRHATISSLQVTWGKVWGHLALKFMGSHPLLLCWPETSPPHSRAPAGGAPVVVDTLIPLLHHLPLPSSSQNHHAMHSQFARSVGVTDRPCLPQHLFWGSPHLTGVPSPLQMLHITFVE